MTPYTTFDNNSLIDDQGHQRFSFWVQRGGYAMNPNRWW